MKIAINTCYGGFGISDQAFERLLTRKGIAFDNEHYLSKYQFNEDRADPDLIAVIEEMAKDAEGWAADIKIVEIPDDVEWQISEYDGMEWVAEKHRTWS